MTGTDPAEGHALFVFGTLLHAPLRAVVLGREVDALPAVLPGHQVVWAEGKSHALLVEGNGEADGLVLTGLSDAEVARIDFYEHSGAAKAAEVLTRDSGARVDVTILGSSGQDVPGAPFRIEDWATRWAETVTEAARDLMRSYGAPSGWTKHRRYPLLLIRSSARVRAQAEGPTTLRRQAGHEDVEEQARREPYAEYFAVEEYDIRFRRFDGKMSDVLTRAVFISGDAAVVLPYDPIRDRVLVIEQWRAGPHARGDRQSWLIEAVAGRVDGGETPEEAALREAREEAGLELRTLLPVAHYYPSPAAKGEYLYSYVGLAELPDEAAGLGGLPGEGEDIRAHVIPFAQLMDLVATGEVNNAPLIVLAYWLDRNRERLRADAGVA